MLARAETAAAAESWLMNFFITPTRARCCGPNTVAAAADTPAATQPHIPK